MSGFSLIEGGGRGGKEGRVGDSNPSVLLVFWDMGVCFFLVNYRFH